MSDVKTGDRAPAFTLPTDGGAEISLGDFTGRNLVLYFYPKDNTPGCTAQACTFRNELPQFGTLNTAILGISKDSVKKHEKFKEKYSLNFPLAADEDGKTCEAYGTWIEKSMYGKKYMGIDRATFLIDGNGVVRKIWRKVKVEGHVEEVKSEIENLMPEK